MERGNRRRLTLFEQMSAVENGRDLLAGLTLDDILGTAKPAPQQRPAQNRTLLEVIRDDDNSNKDNKKSWKSLRDKLRLKRPVSALTFSVHVPPSDVIVDDRSRLSRHSSFRAHPARDEGGGGRDLVPDPVVINSRLHLAPRGSGRFVRNQIQNDHDNSAHIRIASDAPPSRSLRSEITAENGDESPVAREETRQLRAVLALERDSSAREPAVEEPARMSLMDFLEETEQQMGLAGWRYTAMDGEDDDEEKEEKTEASGGMEHTCCVCMVRHKGAAFIPCGHTFCRVCSRELWVQRGNCPLCNIKIQEILDIF